MKRVLTALVLIPLVLYVVVKGPLWLFTLVAGAFCLLAMNEFFDLANRCNTKTFRWQSLLIAGFFFLALSLPNRFSYTSELFSIALGSVLLLPPVFLLFAMARNSFTDSLPAVSYSLFAFGYILLPFVFLNQIRNQYGWLAVLLIFLVVWSGDIFAFYVGKNFGKHHLLPSVSPKKSWEGAIASVIGATAVATLVVWNWSTLDNFVISESWIKISKLPQWDLPVFYWSIAFGVLVNIAAQLGDLAESMLKRGAGVKDSGNLLPGHGGVLDRIDALLFAIPVAVILFAIL